MDYIPSAAFPRLVYLDTYCLGKYTALSLHDFSVFVRVQQERMHSHYL